MRFRLVISTVLLVSVAIILSSTSSGHRLNRRRYYNRRVCKPFSLPDNADWIFRSYGRKCKGIFVCYDGYEMEIKTVCKRGRWKVNIICVEKPNTTPTITTPTTTATTTPSTPETTTPETTTTPEITTTPETTTPTTTTLSTTTLSTTSTTPTPETTTTTTETTTTPVQCDADPTVENGVITSEISTEIGSVVQFNCTAGFTRNGRLGSLTCNEDGDFRANLTCTDCRSDDVAIIIGSFNNSTVTASDEIECEVLCSGDPNCVTSTFVAPSICMLVFKISETPISPGSLEECRQLCYDSSRCRAFTVPTADSQAQFPVCELFTRPFTSIISQEELDFFSTCI